jgi:hypothetical protein
MRTYTGRRDRDRTCQVWVNDAGDARLLPLRLDLYNHSPTGFEWGYGGSGPAQLALALLADALDDDDRAVRLHQSYKFRVIGRLPRDEDWTLSENEILAVVRDLVTGAR